MKILTMAIIMLALAGTSRPSLAEDKLSQVFLRDAIQDNTLKIQMGELVQEKGESSDLKSFSDTLVVDYTLANKEASDIAGQIGMEVPSQPSPSQKAVLDRLAKFKGGAFDRAFIREIIAEHKVDIMRFQNQAKKTDDAVAEYARQMLPTLKSHLDEARKLQAGL